MADSMLESSAVSAFCGGVAVMIAAGIQTDEAVYMLADKHEDSSFKSICHDVYIAVAGGGTLSDAMASTNAFPQYAVSMVAAGEQAGRLEQVLRRLDVYYEEEERTYAKLRSSVSYPAALLAIMSIILVFTVSVILPVFIDVYQNLSGTLTAGSFSSMGISIAIGWVALIVTLVCTLIVVALSLMSRTAAGQKRVMNLFEKLPFTRQAMYQLALSRFTAALSTYVSSGVNTETAMEESAKFVTNPKLREKVEAAYQSMTDANNPRSLAQAINENEVFEPIYARMLSVGIETGSSDEILSRLSQIFFEDALEHLDRAIDHIEPLFAGFLTLTVGATLIAVMLPLIGIMRSIG
ncbi:MAG: type II secretion system F family protein [Coriobacteriales bacterium]|nr:type II secretion system F family protein [Coriobacteriales bacterium]